MDDGDQNLPRAEQETDTQKKKRLPGKRCVVMFCNKTNADNVTLHKFPTDEPWRRKWISFVLAKRDDDWRPGCGHICSDHFTDDCYEGLGAKLAGYSYRLNVKKTAIPSIQVTPTPQQLSAARRLKNKRKLPQSAAKPDAGSADYLQPAYTTPKRTSRALSKLTAHRVGNKLFSALYAYLSCNDDCCH